MSKASWDGVLHADNAASTGLPNTAGWFVDLHCEVARPEYEGWLRSAGLERGWRVLDAGCGTGVYLPWIAELVGPLERVSALDPAPEHVAAARRSSPPRRSRAGSRPG